MPHFSVRVDPFNWLLRGLLGFEGFDEYLTHVRFVVNRDVHTYVGWRDTFDPHLVDLLAHVWGRP